VYLRSDLSREMLNTTTRASMPSDIGRNIVSNVNARLWGQRHEFDVLQWFTKAGFEDVQIKRIGPKWYRGVRRHGLIMGCSVTGRKTKVCKLCSVST